MLISADLFGTIPQGYNTQTFLSSGFFSGEIVAVNYGDPVADEDIESEKGNLVYVIKRDMQGRKIKTTAYHKLCKEFRSVSFTVKTSDPKRGGEFYASYIVSTTKISVEELGRFIRLLVGQLSLDTKKGIDFSKFIGGKVWFRVKARPHGRDGIAQRGTYEDWTFFDNEEQWDANASLFKASQAALNEIDDDPLGLDESGGDNSDESDDEAEDMEDIFNGEDE